MSRIVLGVIATLLGYVIIVAIGRLYKARLERLLNRWWQAWQQRSAKRVRERLQRILEQVHRQLQRTFTDAAILSQDHYVQTSPPAFSRILATRRKLAQRRKSVTRLITTMRRTIGGRYVTCAFASAHPSFIEGTPSAHDWWEPFGTAREWAAHLLCLLESVEVFCASLISCLDLWIGLAREHKHDPPCPLCHRFPECLMRSLLDCGPVRTHARLRDLLESIRDAAEAMNQINRESAVSLELLKLIIAELGQGRNTLDTVVKPRLSAAWLACSYPHKEDWYAIEDDGQREISWIGFFPPGSPVPP